jgi:hypothetical protein
MPGRAAGSGAAAIALDANGAISVVMPGLIHGCPVSFSFTIWGYRVLVQWSMGSWDSCAPAQTGGGDSHGRMDQSKDS